MMAIDPSTRSAGWAYFEAGELKSSGVVKLSDRYPMHQRLPMLYDQVSLLPKVDLLVMEKLTGSMVHPYLHMGAGTAVAGTRAPELILIGIVIWKAVSLVATGYTKTDEWDAKVMGASVIQRAKEMVEDEKEATTDTTVESSGRVETDSATPKQAS